MRRGSPGKSSVRRPSPSGDRLRPGTAVPVPRPLTTAVEASTGGDQDYVKFMGEQEPVNEKGECNQSDFFSVDGKFCGFGGRVDVLKHFMATGGFWGAKETVQKLSR